MSMSCGNGCRGESWARSTKTEAGASITYGAEFGGTPHDGMDTTSVPETGRAFSDLDPSVDGLVADPVGIAESVAEPIDTFETPASPSPPWPVAPTPPRTTPPSATPRSSGCGAAPCGGVVYAADLQVRFVRTGTTWPAFPGTERRMKRTDPEDRYAE